MANVFLVDGDGGIAPMKSAGFENELDFQQLIAQCPDLLPGELLTPDDPRRWLLVARELGIPVEDGGGDNFSLDHLLLDQDGVPTFIEVKRATDTRIRREVVAQMLDYAANATTYSSVEAMQSQMAKYYKTDEDGVFQLVADFLDDPERVESYWQAVKTNLSAARLRLVFVADVIPSGLLRIIEFLNDHTDPLEIIAVEIRQYQHEDGRRMLVPQVLGQTAESRDRKAVTRTRRQWDEASFREDLRNRSDGSATGKVLDALLTWARGHAYRIEYGAGQYNGSIYVVADAHDTWYAPVCIWSNGFIETQFQYLSKRPVFDELGKRQEFAARLNEIEGANLPTDEESLTNRRPSIKTEPASTTDGLAKLISALDWFDGALRAE